MTTFELDGEGTLNHSRIVRVARGSGTSVEEVHLLLEEYKKLGKVIGKLGKTNLGRGFYKFNHNQEMRSLICKETLDSLPVR